MTRFMGPTPIISSTKKPLHAEWFFCAVNQRESAERPPKAAVRPSAAKWVCGSFSSEIGAETSLFCLTIMSSSCKTQIKHRNCGTWAIVAPVTADFRCFFYEKTFCPRLYLRKVGSEVVLRRGGLRCAGVSKLADPSQTTPIISSTKSPVFRAFFVSCPFSCPKLHF